MVDVAYTEFHINHVRYYVWISIKISLKLFPNGTINNIPALVQLIQTNEG